MGFEPTIPKGPVSLPQYEIQDRRNTRLCDRGTIFFMNSAKEATRKLGFFVCDRGTIFFMNSAKEAIRKRVFFVCDRDMFLFYSHSRENKWEWGDLNPRPLDSSVNLSHHIAKHNTHHS